MERIFSTQRELFLNSINWLFTGIAIYIGLVLIRWIYGKLFVGHRTYKDGLLFGIGGVHGAITLAMTFSVQDMVSNSTFSYIIAVETVVILISMIVPTIVFKLILDKDNEAYEKEKIIKNVRINMIQVGINKVKSIDISQKVKNLVIYDLQDQANINTFKSFFREILYYNKNEQVLTQLQSLEQRRALMYAFEAQRCYLYDLSKNNEVKSEYVYEVYNDVLLAQSIVMDPQNQMH